MGKIKRALISVTDKSGVAEFASELAKMGVDIVSTGGTARVIREAGVEVKDISEITGFPEMMDGRVKTLHPLVHGGLLNVRDNADHRKAMEENNIEDIDLVCVNLYRFEQTVAKPDVDIDEAIENIDIGGPSMLRSAAKNWKYVTVVTDPADYEVVLAEMKASGGETTTETRKRLAARVFAVTAHYDSAIADYLEGELAAGEEFAPTLRLELDCRQVLRYGENPHQTAAFYVDATVAEPSVSTARQLSGKDLSFNNIIDINAALEIVKDFADPAISVIKHTNPCGAATGSDLVEVYKAAYAGDPVSAFGSIVGVNRPVTPELADEIASPDRFVEAIIAPSFDKEAVKVLQTKPKWGKNVRLLEVGEMGSARDAEYDMKRVVGGLVLQGRDTVADEFADLKTATKREPSAQELADLKFGWIICKHVKSNAVVLAKDGALLGAGAGQMSRVDSAMIAVRKAGERAKGSVVASDAFFPFPDALMVCADAGATAAIQPGGAKNDPVVIEAADDRDLAMVLTGMRHFKH